MSGGSSVLGQRRYLDTEAMNAIIRPPAVAGLFYPGDSTALREAVNQCYERPRGPGPVVAAPDGPKRVRGLMAPHAGYMYSGYTAAHSFAALAADGPPDSVVIIGPNHRGVGAPLAVPEADAWRTPLGDVPIDSALRDALLQLDPGVTADDSAFQAEHSQEVMLPFLQALYGSDTPILPICWGKSDLTALAFGAVLGRALQNDPRRIVLIASTDFSHYVPAGYAVANDRHALDMIEAMDGVGLIKVVRERDITMCGVSPTAIVIAALRGSGATASVLNYSTSGDVTGDRRSVVGYGAAVFAVGQPSAA